MPPTAIRPPQGHAIVEIPAPARGNLAPLFRGYRHDTVLIRTVLEGMLESLTPTRVVRPRPLVSVSDPSSFSAVIRMLWPCPIC